MIQIVAATFEDGVFKPDEQPELPENARVRLLVETMEESSEKAGQNQAWIGLEQIWRQSTFDSHGDRLSRDQLHERH